MHSCQRCTAAPSRPPAASYSRFFSCDAGRSIGPVNFGAAGNSRPYRFRHRPLPRALNATRRSNSSRNWLIVLYDPTRDSRPLRCLPIQAIRRLPSTFFSFSRCRSAADSRRELIGCRFTRPSFLTAWAPAVTGAAEPDPVFALRIASGPPPTARLLLRPSVSTCPANCLPLAHPRRVIASASPSLKPFTDPRSSSVHRSP